jgi:Spy/CpxP family protein refolding chaperone
MNRLVQGLMALVVVVFAGSWLVGQDTTPKLRGQLYPKWRQLGLTDEQKQQVYKIQAEYRTKIRELEAKIKQLRTEELTKAAAILTPAQKTRLRELSSGLPTEKEKAPPKEKPPVKEKTVKDK